MEITIKLTGKQIKDVIDAAEAQACKDWFEGDEKEYANWAGDVAGNIILYFLDKLYIKHDIRITVEEQED